MTKQHYNMAPEQAAAQHSQAEPRLKNSHSLSSIQNGSMSSVQQIIAAATASGELTEVDVLHIQEDGSVTWASDSLDILSITNLYAEYEEVKAVSIPPDSVHIQISHNLEGEKEPLVKAEEEELVWGEGPEPTFKECIQAEQNGEPISWGETQPSWEITDQEIQKVEEEVTLDCPTVDTVDYHYQQPTPLPRAYTEQFSHIKEDFQVLEEQLEAIRSSARWIFREKTINLQNYEERYREVYPADEKSPFFTPFTIEGPLTMHGFYTSYLMQIKRITEEYIKTRHQAQFRLKVVKEANPTKVSAQEVVDLCNNNPQYKCLI
ncbi:hypothetical protein FRB99_006501 [Tulasnella sp. 403]|nr:hypothetical protein FRB99_006501 [Tulasnella sp. 403]